MLLGQRKEMVNHFEAGFLFEVEIVHGSQIHKKIKIQIRLLFEEGTDWNQRLRLDDDRIISKTRVGFNNVLAKLLSDLP